MAGPRHFCFEALEFERLVAHGGEGQILTRQVLNAGAGAACNFIDMTIVPPGTSIGMHTHAEDNEEIYVVISGRGEMRVDGERIDVAAGHVIANRPGGTHGLRNTGDDELRLVVIEVPSGGAKPPR